MKKTIERMGIMAMTKREMIKALMFIQESLIHVHEVLAKVDDRVEQLRNVLNTDRASNLTKTGQWKNLKLLRSLVVPTGIEPVFPT